MLHLAEDALSIRARNTMQPVEGELEIWPRQECLHPLPKTHQPAAPIVLLMQKDCCNAQPAVECLTQCMRGLLQVARLDATHSTFRLLKSKILRMSFK